MKTALRPLLASSALAAALLGLAGCSTIEYTARDPETKVEYGLKIRSLGVKREIKKMTIGTSTIEGFSSDQVEAMRAAFEAGVAASKVAK